jgi:hypothetical protein
MNDLKECEACYENSIKYTTHDVEAAPGFAFRGGRAPFRKILRGLSP